MNYPAEFEQALAMTLGEEGGFSNAKGDRGGPTMAGVTQATYDDYRTLLGLPRKNVRSSTPEERKDLYYQLFWNLGRCDMLLKPSCFMHFDACVNHGPRTAARILQGVLNAQPIDGAIGTRTLAKVKKFEAKDLARKIITARRGFYIGLLVTNPKDADADFIDGWLNRMDNVEHAL